MVNIITSVLASTVRAWRGTSAIVRDKQPDRWLILYDMEGCPYCRVVREVLTELDLNVLIKPCPKKGAGYWDELSQLNSKKQVPYLHDENTGKSIPGSEQIVEYLYANYGMDSDSPVTQRKPLLALSKLATLLRSMKGMRGRKAHRPEQPLILYSFESSPFSRPVRERLTELGLSYRLYNAGKQQLADQGLGSFRPVIGRYRPLPGTNRAILMEMMGKVQFPFLEDPNTGKKIFESKIIIEYLNRTYQLPR